MSMPRAAGEPPEFGREWAEILEELRVALPGVQLLFGFLLAAPFTAPPHALVGFRRAAYFFSFLTAAAAAAFLIAPSVYHRLHWRRDVRDKEQMLLTSNRLAIAGEALLAAAMTGTVFVVADLMVGGFAAIAITAGAGALFVLLWFALPLSRRAREQRAPPP